MVSSINGIVKTGELHTKKYNCIPTLHHTLKINSKWIKDLNLRPETVKILEENMEVHCLTSILAMIFGSDTKAEETKGKINMWDHIQLKSFCGAKKPTNKIKRQPMVSEVKILLRAV